MNPLGTENLPQMYLYQSHLEGHLQRKRYADYVESLRFSGLRRRAFLLRRMAETALLQHQLDEIKDAIAALDGGHPRYYT